jgi:hypothetical protein
MTPILTHGSKFQRYFMPAFWHCAGIAAGLGLGLTFGVMLGVVTTLYGMAQ